MKKLLLACLFLLVALPVAAGELLMFSNPHCGFCQSFLNEVKPTYHKTEYAKYLPLKVINITEEMPKWIQTAMEERRLTPIRNTPTFVIWDNNEEVARLVGYGGKEKISLKHNTGLWILGRWQTKQPLWPMYCAMIVILD